MRTEVAHPALETAPGREPAPSTPDTAPILAFDRLAERYDAICENPLFRSMREAVHEILEARFAQGPRSAEGARVLEIGCGTGIDSAFLASRGVEVVACDPAPGMILRAERRARTLGLVSRLEFHSCGVDELDARLDAREALDGRNPQLFDGIFSDFGALNCVERLDSLRILADRRLRRGGRLVLCLLGPFCLWEVLYFLLRADPRRALRRLRPRAAQPVPIPVDGIDVPTIYHRPGDIASALGSEYSIVSLRGLGVFAPPPYLIGLWNRLPASLRGALLRADAQIAGGFPWNRIGDHYVMEIAKR